MKIAIVELAMLALIGCSCSASQKQTEMDVATLSNAACQILDTQTEPDWLHLLCSVEEAAHPGVTKLIEMRVLRAPNHDAGKDGS